MTPAVERGSSTVAVMGEGSPRCQAPGNAPAEELNHHHGKETSLPPFLSPVWLKLPLLHACRTSLGRRVGEVERAIPDTKRRIFLPALSMDTAAMATEDRRTRPTRAASYSGFCKKTVGKLSWAKGQVPTGAHDLARTVLPVRDWK